MTWVIDNLLLGPRFPFQCSRKIEYFFLLFYRFNKILNYAINIVIHRRNPLFFLLW